MMSTQTMNSERLTATQKNGIFLIFNLSKSCKRDPETIKPKKIFKK